MVASRGILGLGAAVLLLGAVSACTTENSGEAVAPEVVEQTTAGGGALGSESPSAVPPTSSAEVSAAPGEGQEQDVFSLVVGDCLADSGLEGDSISTTNVVDCGSPHTYEVYASHQIVGDVFDEGSVTNEAESVCRAEFQTFVGMSYDDSVLVFTSLYPTDESWAADDREILCLIADEEGGPTAGSLRGANR